MDNLNADKALNQPSPNNFLTVRGEPKCKKIVYVAHPIGGDVKWNMIKVKFIIKEILRTQSENVIPIAPYLTFLEILDDHDEAQRALGMSINTALLLRCVDEVWLYGERISAGMQAEIDLARAHLITVVAKTVETEKALYGLK